MRDAAAASSHESAVARSIRLMDCSLTQTPHGWLAVSAPGSLIRIGVMGATANEALRAFRASATEWARLHDLPVAPMAGVNT